MVSTKTKTKNIILLALVSMTFILSVVSYTTQQQAFAQGMFQTQQSDSERNQTSLSSPIKEEQVIIEEVPGLASQSAKEGDQKIILGDITIPITSDTTLSLEMPDSKITVQPNK